MKNNLSTLLLPFLFMAIGVCIAVMCNKCQSNETSIQTSDTLSIVDSTIHIDTVYFHDTVVHEVSIAIPVPTLIDTAQNIALYADSTVNDEISIYWADTIQGILLGKHLAYKLHVPKEIVKTIEIEKINTITKTLTQHKLYGELEMGTNEAQLGVFFMPKKGKYSAGYSYSFINKSHNIKLGYQLWASK